MESVRTGNLELFGTNIFRVSVKITEQYFNANFNAHQNDFTLNNGNYEATFRRDVLDMVHENANDGSYKNYKI